MTRQMILAKRTGQVLLGIAIAISSQYTSATSSNPSTTVKVSVKVQEVPCHINNDKEVSVEFGTVLSSKLDSVAKQIPLEITCDNAPTGTVKFKIKGNSAAFDSSALLTDVDVLGVKFYSSSDSLMKLNETYDVSSLSKSIVISNFCIVAKLTKKDGATLSGGEFNSSATLVLITE
ncbi:fimbrial protein [Klebsiella aerogenes]|uniref:fimbrial protein n=1 Tax=Klebsiella aerogenes TaxID=548 RepID=UPI001906DA9F|nr:fimbrial protein [Klebsiella aerogenes]MBK0469657.1 fimbrial protein [Klebsiella aerogenes]